MSPGAPRCPLCAGERSRRFTVQRGFRWVRCGDCGLAYLWPRPSSAELDAAYQGYLPRDEGGLEAWRDLMADVFRQALRLLGPPPPGGRLLDAGCAYGFFLEAAATAGWQARGIDLSVPAVDYARGRGLAVECGGLEDARVEPESLDAVTLFYVLEHLPDPVAAVRRVRGWLRPGGRLLLRVPHTAPLVSALGLLGIPNELLDPPFHLSDFPPAALRRLLEEAGFEGVRTLPGAATRPAGALAFAVTKLGAGVAGALHAATAGRCLVPGVSKTTLAARPLHP